MGKISKAETCSEQIKQETIKKDVKNSLLSRLLSVPRLYPCWWDDWGMFVCLWAVGCLLWLITGPLLSPGHFLPPGFTLTMSAVAAVFTDVTIAIKWLLKPSLGKPLCRLSTGDGHAFHVDSPVGWGIIFTEGQRGFEMNLDFSACENMQKDFWSSGELCHLIPWWQDS